jgi:class 3 adenylate cyclase
MQQVADWLEKLGLGQYAQRFAENDIEIEVLGELTDADFDRLGVSIGHRRKLLKALAAGMPGADAAPQSSSTSARLTRGPGETAEATEATGERRHVTVMFCDLVDSTGIAAKLDAEEWRDLVGAYIDAASAAVVEMGATSPKISPLASSTAGPASMAIRAASMGLSAPPFLRFRPPWSITVPSRSRRLTAPRYAKWWRSSPPATRCRRK